MQPQPHLSTRDVRTLFTLEGEVHELAEQSTGLAVAHLAAAMPRLFGDAVLWWSVMREPLVPVSSRVFGFDESSLRRWEQGYLLEGEYAEHPMWPGLLSDGRAKGATRRRVELVDDRAWYRSPHIAEWCRGLGYDDVLASVVPLAAKVQARPTFAFMGLVRPWAQRHFAPGDAALFHVLTRRVGWLSHRVALEAAGTRREALSAALPAHLRRVHRLLLSGASEKEIAAQLGLSARTVHKYVERLYDAFDVQSRAQLMALWIDPHAVG